MRWCISLFCLPAFIYTQGKLRVGKGIGPQDRLLEVDTVFQLRVAPLYLWMEARFVASPAPDTLWAVVRSSKRSASVFALYRSKVNRNLYWGRLIFRKRGIYHVFVYPPRQSRPVLAFTRVYITDAELPTPSALRSALLPASPSSHTQKVLSGRVSSPSLGASGGSNATKSTTSNEAEGLGLDLGEIDVPPDKLLREEALPSIETEEELDLEDDYDFQMDFPEGMEEEEEIDLEGVDLEEL